MTQLLFSYIFRTNLAAFRTAILNDDTDKICRILDVQRDHLHKDIDKAGNSGLLLAIQYASPVTVRLLLALGAPPDCPNSLTFQTPLSLLASTVYEDWNSHEAKIALEMARSLLDAGAYVDKPSPHTYLDEQKKAYTGKETPLMTAVRKKNLSMATLFVDRRANVNYVERTSQIRPIHMAVSNGDEDIFDLLESAGASCRSVISAGENTLLHWFCYKPENDTHLSLLEKLLNKGCEIDAENWHQRTPLMLAAQQGLPNTCRALLKARARVDTVDYKGNRAVDLAAPNSACWRLLVQATEAQQPQLHRQRVPRIVSSENVVWRKRLGGTRRPTSQSSDLSDVENHTPNSRKVSSIFSEENNKSIGEPLKNSSTPYIYPFQQRESEEMDTKYERMWDKLLQSRRRHRIRIKSQQRTSDTDNEYGS